VTIRPAFVAEAIAAGLPRNGHHGGAIRADPPLAMYLLPLGLSKEVYAGTTKACSSPRRQRNQDGLPWLCWCNRSRQRLDNDGGLRCSPFRPAVWGRVAASQKAGPTATLTGPAYGLLIVTALKTVWDCVRGLSRVKCPMSGTRGHGGLVG